MINVALIAPVRAYRDALAAAMCNERELQLVALASSAPEALARMSPVQPTVALLDFGIEDILLALAALRRASPTTYLIVIGVGQSPSQTMAVVGAAEAGVSGFVDAAQPLSDIIAAIRLAVQGQSSCSPRIAALLLQALRRRPMPPSIPLGVSSSVDAGLTSRENVVAELVAQGLTNRQIADQLVLGESTVKSHVHSILRKMGLHRRGEILPAATLNTENSHRWNIPPSDGEEMEESRHPQIPPLINSFDG